MAKIIKLKKTISLKKTNYSSTDESNLTKADKSLLQWMEKNAIKTKEKVDVLEILKKYRG